MSLVNDMLRDLDRRRRHPVGTDNARIAIDSDAGVISGNRKLLFIASAFAAMAVVVAIAFFIRDSVPQSMPRTTAGFAESPLAQRETQREAQSETQNEAQRETQQGTDAATQAATPAANVDQPSITVRVAGERRRTNGIELRLEATEKVLFEVLARTGTSISVLLSGVDTLSNSITSLEGIEMDLVDDGLLVNIAMDRETDFVVYENSNAFTFAMAIEGFWQVLPELTSVSGEEPEPAAFPGSDMTASTPAAPPASPDVVRNDAPRVSEGNSAPVRTQREPSLQERDRNASQQALRQVQNGQMQTAFVALNNFVSTNPEAHQSRSTLITLLYAQQEYDQVGLLVEEGLSLAPNSSSYKKMKARLLMMQGQHEQAIALLKNVPPAVAEDKEYFELLASLYQQTGAFTAAITTYQELIRTDSNVGRWWAGMGISHEAMGNTRDAVNSFEVALQTPSLESSLRQYSRNRIRSLSGQ